MYTHTHKGVHTHANKVLSISMVTSHHQSYHTVPLDFHWTDSKDAYIHNSLKGYYAWEMSMVP